MKEKRIAWNKGLKGIKSFKITKNTRFCLVCKKPLRSDNKTGYCKPCYTTSPEAKEWQLQYRQRNNSWRNKKRNEWRKKNKPKIEERICEECYSLFTHHRQKNVSFCSKSCCDKNYNKLHKEETNERARNRFHYNIQSNLRTTIRGRIGKALERYNIKTPKKTIKYIGCTVPELKAHLEAQFKSGMSWENHSNHGWHIDHILPLASFDLTKEENLYKACHYTNLQPLWAIDNLKKNDKLNYDKIPTGDIL